MAELTGGHRTSDLDGTQYLGPGVGASSSNFDPELWGKALATAAASFQTDTCGGDVQQATVQTFPHPGSSQTDQDLTPSGGRHFFQSHLEVPSQGDVAASFGE
jgi:hypothetical protein